MNPKICLVFLFHNISDPVVAGDNKRKGSGDMNAKRNRTASVQLQSVFPPSSRDDGGGERPIVGGGGGSHAMRHSSVPYLSNTGVQLTGPVQGATVKYDGVKNLPSTGSRVTRYVL